MSNWDIEALSAAAKYRGIDADGPVRAILFENEAFHGEPTEVFAYLGMPRGEGRPVPGMVCVHGGGGKAFRRWVEMWQEREWHTMPAELTAGAAEAILPEDVTACFLSIEDALGRYVNAPCLEIGTGR